MTSYAVCKLGVVVLFAASACRADTASIISLGVSPSWPHGSTATTVSGNGLVVGGNSGEAYRWSSATGMVLLGTLPGTPYSFPISTNFDGSVIVGQAGDTGTPTRRAFRWTTGAGFQDLGSLPGLNGATAYAVSNSGNLVAGTSGVWPNDRAFRWTPSGGMQQLLPTNVRSLATGISGDESTIVGLFGTDYRAFRWSSSTGLVELPGLVANGACSAGAANFNGSIVAGTAYVISGDYHPVRWVSGVIQDLGLLPGHSSAGASDISADASVIVGISNIGSQERPFIWTAWSGMQSLDAYLQARGANLTGWTLERAYSISEDGSRVVGHGIYNGRREAFVAVIPAAGTGFLVLGGAGVGIRRRRRDYTCA